MPKRKLRIGIDIDDVLIKSAELSIQLYNEEYGTKLSLDDWYDFSDPSTYVKVWASEDVTVLVKRVVHTMVNDAFLDVEPIEGSQEGLRHLNSEGHQLFAITGRSESIRRQTMAMLDKNFDGIFTDNTLFFVDHFEHDGKKASKAVVGTQLELTHFIDDFPDHANAIARVGIKTVLFDAGNYKWSKTGIDADVASNVIELDSWQRTVEYLDDEAAQ